MTMKKFLEVKEADTLATLRSFLKGLLEKEIIEALLVPLEAPSGDTVMPALVKEPARLEKANPLAPVMPVNAARLVSSLTIGKPREKIGALLRSCEIRALIELVKLQQAHLENLMIIGIDCLGTYEVTDYAKLISEDRSPTMELVREAKEGALFPHEGYQFRSACRICEYPMPQDAALTIGLLGVDGEKILIEAQEELAGRLELTEGEATGREEVIRKLVGARIEERDRIFAQFRERVVDMPSLLAQFSTCIRCHNCTVACPICYCKECLFRTSTFEHESDRYLRWAQRKGAIQMPTDTLLFQLTRLNHMVTSCVGCGMCESACPSDIPLTTIFRAVGQEVQAMFDYLPGRSLEDELPLATFKEDELTELGER
ncbi:MAG TPA: formate dehydrogenase [Chloroflexi bacterium]|nr:formate dehydrogenase [Chloroflexota bacterium]